MSIKYELIIYWSDEDQSFVVEVPELPGCMADGESYEEGVANAQQVIEEGDRDGPGAWSFDPRASRAINVCIITG